MMNWGFAISSIVFFDALLFDKNGILRGKGEKEGLEYRREQWVEEGERKKEE